jgi:AraC-like DNA-binding protein
VELHQPPEPVVISTGAWSAKPGQHAPPHRHAAWKITYYRTGRITSIVDGEWYDIVPGTVLVLRPDQAHEEIAHTGYSNYYTLVDAGSDQPWPVRCDGDDAHAVGRISAALLRETSSPDPSSPAMTAALMTELDVTLRRHDPAVAPTAAERTLRAAERVVEEAYARPLSVAALATSVGVSASTLRAHFATAAGVAPLEFVRRVRLRHALGLLRTSDLSLAAVAARCGFDSASHLSRHVKAAVGSSPGRLRPGAGQPAQR